MDDLELLRTIILVIGGLASSGVAAFGKIRSALVARSRTPRCTHRRRSGSGHRTSSMSGASGSLSKQARWLDIWRRAMPVRRPRWQVEECPRWCIRTHAQDDHPDDRVHVSEGAIVPVIERVTAPVDSVFAESVQSVDIIVGLRRDGTGTTWVHLADDERRGFELTKESARRLHERLGIALEHD